MFVRSTSRTSCRFSAWAVITAVMAFVAAAAALTAPSAAAAANSDRLNPNEQLNNEARLISPNGQSRRVRARQPADLGDGNKHPRLGRANAGRRQSCDNRAGQHSRLGQRDERSRRGRCAPNSGRFTTMSASARAYSANAPWQKPSTSSPGRTVVGRSGLGPVPAGAGMPAPGSRAGRDESRCRVRGFASTTRRPTAAGGK
jgi:hypothetical protein